MNYAAAISATIALLEALPLMITTTEQVLALIKQTSDNLQAMQAADRDPTTEEWDDIHQTIASLRAQ